MILIKIHDLNIDPDYICLYRSNKEIKIAYGKIVQKSPKIK